MGIGIGSSKGALLCDLEVPRIDQRSFPHDRQTKSMSQIMKKKTDLLQMAGQFCCCVHHIRCTKVCLEAVITLTHGLRATHQRSPVGALMHMLVNRVHSRLLECIAVGIVSLKILANTTVHYALADLALRAVSCTDLPSTGNLGRHHSEFRMEVHELLCEPVLCS